MTTKDAPGRPNEVDCHVTFSLGGPFAVEIWQAMPGTPQATPEAGWPHHIGYWVDELGSDGVDAGPLDASWRQQPGTPVYTADLSADGARRALAAAEPENTSLA